MNRIEMYASSTHLKHGLHRVLATAAALSHPVEAGARRAWWSHLQPHEQEPGRQHRLSLEALAAIYARPAVQAVLDAGRAAVGLPPLDHAAAQADFKVAIISSRAHRAHLGRDVYGASNKGLWDRVCGEFGAAVAARFGPSLGEPPVPRSDSAPSAATLAVLEQLTAFDTGPEGADHDGCVAWLVRLLESHGFRCEVMGRALGKPLLVARRPARGLAGHVALYGHYDVTPFGRASKWAHDPRRLTVTEGRLHARGVGDNKGPLACRLAALAELTEAPALTWLVQGEEETGSPVAHALLPEIMADLRPDLWLEETGYHDHEDGTLRLLARTLGPADESRPPDPAMAPLLGALEALASRWGVAARHEQRGLNKSVVAGGCPFNANLPEGARYLALGVNDSGSRIHGLNESVPAWTFPLHAAQLDVVFRWVGQAAGAAQ